MNTMKENRETRIYPMQCGSATNANAYCTRVYPVKYTAMLCNEHSSYFTGWKFIKFARLTN